ncbi:MAG: PQQ-binding-like beta-propeller repeat protein, partial [Rhabdochlamydiaceae bacterium]
CNIGLNPGGYPIDWRSLDMVIEDGRIYALAGSDAGTLAKASALCVSLSDGDIIWRHDLAQGDSFSFFWSKYAASTDAIFYSTQAGHVVALSKADGSTLWDSPNGSISIPALYQSQPCYRNGVVYVGSCPRGKATIDMYRDGVIVALDAKTGSKLWAKILPPPDSSIIGYASWKLLNNNQIEASPIPTVDGIIIEPGYCVALMDSTGQILWRSAPNINGGLSPYIWQPFLFNGQLYSYNTGNGSFFAYDIDANTGAIKWVRSTKQPNNSTTINPPMIDSDGLYEVTDDAESSLWGQSLSTGSTFLYTPLMWYNNSSNDAFDNEYLVSNKRIYYQTQNEMICIERK